MSRLAANAQVWTAVYEAFASVNFGAYDYNSIKTSLIEYIKLNFPEVFNDFIETSEVIVIIENFAYIAELCAYRIDVSAHENFISTAQRKESILRLAKFISYTASRPLPARGLVKITSVRTTENVTDSLGTNITNYTVRWNDTNNSNWKDQFITILNKSMQQSVGYVNPQDRFQIQDVLFELYHMNNTTMTNGIISYSVSTPTNTLPFELVPVTYDPTYNIIERRPDNSSTFSILYGQDGLGDSSETTGFFMFTKQGKLNKIVAEFDGITPNQSFVVSTHNVNDIDVWVNNVNSEGKLIQTTGDPNYGEWVAVDTTYNQNIMYNTITQPNKYEIETLPNNQIKIRFGDGTYADIPSGKFNIWTRTSADSDEIIPRNSIVDKTASIPYIDGAGKTQTLTITFSLISPLQNGSSAESIERIRINAPGSYYAQDRMVNGTDYNTLMLQDPTIIKLQSNNRTFAGDSKYITWHDARGAYENVKMFSKDGVIYFQDDYQTNITNTVSIDTLITSYLTPILSSVGMFIQLTSRGVSNIKYRKTFNNDEINRITTALTPPTLPVMIDMYYNIVTNEWYAIKSNGAGPADDPAIAPTWPTHYINVPLISIVQTSVSQTAYQIDYLSRSMVCTSATTKFWNVNNNRVINYDTLMSNYDTITILQANLNCNRDNILQSDIVCNLLSQQIYQTGPNIGQVDYNSVNLLTQDSNYDGLPDKLNLSVIDGLGELIAPKVSYVLADMTQSTDTYTLPIYYIKGQGDVIIRDAASGDLVTSYWMESSNMVSNVIYMDASQIATIVNSLGDPIEKIIVYVNEYVYFSRETVNSPWVHVLTTLDNIDQYVKDVEQGVGTKTRYQGKDGINFEWVHITPSFHLTDPSPTNIIDQYIITKGYYTAVKNWVNNNEPKPQAPTPLQLRLAYGLLTNKKMFSDSVILHPGKIKLLFGDKSAQPLQGKFKVIKSADRKLTDSQIKNIITATVRNFFDIQLWNFGETFYFTELAAAIHNALPSEINSVVLVPIMSQNHFGNMFQVTCQPDEIFYCDITPDDIEIVQSYTQTNINIGT